MVNFSLYVIVSYDIILHYITGGIKYIAPVHAGTSRPPSSSSSSSSPLPSPSVRLLPFHTRHSTILYIDYNIHIRVRTYNINSTADIYNTRAREYRYTARNISTADEGQLGITSKRLVIPLSHGRRARHVYI